MVFKMSVAPVIDIFGGIRGQMTDGLGVPVAVAVGVWANVCDPEEEADADPVADEDDVPVTDEEPVDEFEGNIKQV
jgi:hypothetical protein